MKRTHTRRSPMYLAYIGEIVSILVFLTLGQVLIQLVLLGQHTTSTTATLIHQQELRSQKLLRNSLLLLLPDAQSRKEPVKELKVDLPVWEAAHHTLERLVFNALPAARRDAIRIHYSAMDGGLHTLLADEGRTYKTNRERLTAEGPARSAVFYHEIPNIVTLDAIYSAINAQADALNTLTRILEIILYGLAVGFLTLGYFFVVRPARAREKEWEALLEEARTRKKGGDNRKEPSP